MNKHRVFLIDCVRTPWGKPCGRLERFASNDLASAAINALIARNKVASHLVDDVIFAQAHPSSKPSNVARYAALSAGIPETVSAKTVLANSASGLQALRSAFHQIASGHTSICVTGGVDSYSAAPFSLRNVRSQFQPEDRMIADTIDEAEMWTQPVPESRLAHYEKVFGRVVSCEAQKYIQESYDKIPGLKKACECHVVSMMYQDRKKGDVVVSEDEWLMKEERLQPVSPYADGGAAALIMSAESAAKHGIKPVFEICGFAFTACNPVVWQEAGAKAVFKLLQKQKICLKQVASLEISENSAEDVCLTKNLLDVRTDKWPAINPLGGALILGKNDGADGFLQLLSLSHNLKEGENGIACVSSAGGLGMAMLVKRVSH